MLTVGSEMAPPQEEPITQKYNKKNGIEKEKENLPGHISLWENYRKNNDWSQLGREMLANPMNMCFHFLIFHNANYPSLLSLP